MAQMQCNASNSAEQTMQAMQNTTPRQDMNWRNEHRHKQESTTDLNMRHMRVQRAVQNGLKKRKERTRQHKMQREQHRTVQNMGNAKSQHSTTQHKNTRNASQPQQLQTHEANTCKHMRTQ